MDFLKKGNAPKIDLGRWERPLKLIEKKASI